MSSAFDRLVEDVPDEDVLPDPEKIDPDDLLFQTSDEVAAALAAAPVDVAALGHAILKELEVRVSNPKTAKDIPGTTLLKLSSYFIERHEREARERESRVDDRFLSAVEVIDHPGLPVDRREELIRDHLQRIEVDRELLEAKLKEMTAA